MTINTELFQKIHDQIVAHPEHHNQATYEEDVARELRFITQGEEGEDYAEAVKEATHRRDGGDICGTTRCVAGWALHFHNPEQGINQTAAEVLDEAGTDGGYSGDLFEGARLLLGISVEQADDLFDGGLDETKAVEMVRRYAAGEDVETY